MEAKTKNEEIFENHFNAKMHGSLEDFKKDYRTLYGVILSSMEEAAASVKPQFSDAWMQENDTEETVVGTTISMSSEKEMIFGTNITGKVFYVKGVNDFIGRVRGKGSMSNHYYFHGHAGIVTASNMYDPTQEQIELLRDKEIHYINKK